MKESEVRHYLRKVDGDKTEIPAELIRALSHIKSAVLRYKEMYDNNSKSHSGLKNTREYTILRAMQFFDESVNSEHEREPAIERIIKEYIEYLEMRKKQKNSKLFINSHGEFTVVAKTDFRRYSDLTIFFAGVLTTLGLMPRPSETVSQILDKYESRFLYISAYIKETPNLPILNTKEWEDIHTNPTLQRLAITHNWQQNSPNYIAYGRDKDIFSIMEKILADQTIRPTLIFEIQELALKVASISHTTSEDEISKIQNWVDSIRQSILEIVQDLTAFTFIMSVPGSFNKINLLQKEALNLGSLDISAEEIQSTLVDNHNEFVSEVQSILETHGLNQFLIRYKTIINILKNGSKESALENFWLDLFEQLSAEEIKSLLQSLNAKNLEHHPLYKTLEIFFYVKNCGWKIGGISDYMTTPKINESNQITHFAFQFKVIDSTGKTADIHIRNRYSHILSESNHTDYKTAGLKSKDNTAAKAIQLDKNSVKS